MNIITKNGYRFYFFENQKFPSVTTILNATLERPELEIWREITPDADKIAAEAAVIGSACHYRILSRYSIRQLEPPTVYLPWKNLERWIEEIAYRSELAEVMWNETIDGISFEPLYVEHSLISREHRYAGTFDLLAEIEGKRVLIDLKTSKELWSEYKLQLGAYYLLCEENGLEVDVGMLVGLHPFETENPALKPETIWLNRKELKEYGSKFTELVREFYANFRED